MSSFEIRTLCGRNSIGCFILAVLTCAVSGCRRGESTAHSPATVAQVALAENRDTPGPCDLILAAHAGTDRRDLEISRLQATLRGETNNAFQNVERLGWLFVAKARESFDPGYYKLAEQCALCLESHRPRAAEALLLRGHVLQNLHRFKEAEVLARELVARRGLAFDYGLLGDTLMEQGSLSAAAGAYQAMVDQKPDLQAYARISYLRWLKGDVAGAARVIKLAAGAASPNSPEPAAWINTRAAFLAFQQGKLEEAGEACRVALDYQPDYPPALLLSGRLSLAQGKLTEAIEVLKRAVQLNPLPDYEWALSEALRAANQENDATALEANLLKEGPSTDPRTLALYLASRGQMPGLALELAAAELQTRGDIFTHDALAWSLAASGKIAEARSEMKRALSEGTQDARLFLHAGVIAARAGEMAEARVWRDRTLPLMPLLLPSEQKEWRNLSTQLGPPETAAVDAPSATATIFTSKK